MLRDVIELRQNKWIPRREENYNPKTIDQIHKEAQMEKMQEQRLAAQLPAKDNKHKKGGPGNTYILITVILRTRVVYELIADEVSLAISHIRRE